MTKAAGLFGLKGWQALFIVEGLAAVALGILAWFALNDDPNNAKWLRSEEKELLRADLEIMFDASNLTRELVRRNGRYGLETMCIGGGQGIAAIFERV